MSNKNHRYVRSGYWEFSHPQKFLNTKTFVQFVNYKYNLYSYPNTEYCKSKFKIAIINLPYNEFAPYVENKWTGFLTRWTPQIEGIWKGGKLFGLLEFPMGCVSHNRRRFRVDLQNELTERFALFVMDKTYKTGNKLG